MEQGARIYVAGHKGLVGSAIMEKLKREGYDNLIYHTSAELDLRRQDRVEAFFSERKPEFVFLTAARVGGIQANNRYSAEFIYDNLMIQTNVIHAAYQNGVKKLLFTGSTCIYPKYAEQPLKEEYLLTGKLEETNEAYAIAKIAGIKMCQHYNKQYGTNYIAVMPTNLYGPGDNFDLETAHVLPALLRKFHEAKDNGQEEVVIWGTGKPRREFLYINDLADALFYLMKNCNGNGIVNIGTGEDISIKGLALLIKKITGYPGRITFDTSKPDGTPRKLVDVSRLNKIGWKPYTGLKDGIKKTYQWYRDNH